MTSSASSFALSPDSKTVAALLPGSLLLTATLLSYTVLPDQLSLHLKIVVHQEHIAGLLRRLAATTQGRYFLPCTLNGTSLLLSIISVTSTKHATSLRCRAIKHPSTAAMLLELVGRHGLSLTIGAQHTQPVVPQTTPHLREHAGAQPADTETTAGEAHNGSLPSEEALTRVLVQAAGNTGSTPETLLQSLTSFRRPDQSVYQGCATIRELSVKQRQVVYARLIKLCGGHHSTRRGADNPRANPSAFDSKAGSAALE